MDKMLEDNLSTGMNRRQLEKVVDQISKKLGDFYDRNWRMICESLDRLHTMSILSWAAFSLRPLIVSEITEAVLVDDEET